MRVSLLSIVCCYSSVWILCVIRPAFAALPVFFDDSSGFGRDFEGIGGLSAGASTKLLVNYPTQLRDEILDYMFKPSFGAALQILKVEIGGDAQSTDGTEASHMHYSWEENYERGYEWWLMKEAKKDKYVSGNGRTYQLLGLVTFTGLVGHTIVVLLIYLLHYYFPRNPDIKLYGLAWGFPGWVGLGTQSPYTNVSVTDEYIVKWINGAKVHHNLTIDYIGIWNERPYNVSCIKTLRTLLDEQGFQNVQMIMSDNKWEIVPEIVKDPSLAKVIHAVGCHYPGTFSPDQAIQTGKQLWASEDYSTFNDNVGGGCWARILNQNYVNGLITSTISWALIGSYYDGFPYYSDGLMTAAEPWSGFYEVSTPIWFTAHTTQFSQPGWRYLKHGSGVGKLPLGGSYVGLVSQGGAELTIVIETMTHDHSLCIRPDLPQYTVQPQNVTITLKGSFAEISEMNVWYSKLGFNGTSNIMFEKKDSLKFTNGQSTLSLDLDEMFTLTTVDGGQKGLYPDPPASRPFPLPYMDDFEGYKQYEEPYNLSPQKGSFEVISNGTNQFIRQTVLQTPVVWCGAVYFKTFALIGSVLWNNLFIEIEFEIPGINGTDGVFIAARVHGAGCESYSAPGIFFFLLQDKYVVANDLERTQIITEGALKTEPGWHKLSLLVQNTTAVGAVDEKGVFNTSIPGFPVSGWAAIGTDSFGLADFDNLFLAAEGGGLEKMKSYFKYNFQPLQFSSEQN